MKPTQKRNKNKKNVRLEKLLVRGTSHPDLSSLRKPVDTSVSDLHQVSKLLEDSTEEVKSILSYECNIIYECRICHSLFRSIVNFMSHKREYCREKFDITLHRRVFNNYNMDSVRESVIHLYKSEQRTAENNSIENDRILRSQVPKEKNKKDLTAIIDMLLNKRREEDKKQLENENIVSNTPEKRHIYLEAIDTNCSAVYQTIKPSDKVDNALDLMNKQIMELQTTIEEQMSENQLEKSDNPIQANMNDEENVSLIHKLPINNLSCSICNAKFLTKKTLTAHMKMLHISKRLFYPCPCCKKIFANTWGVYRHLYKVHKKTTTQVRKLRQQIQEEAFHTDTTTIKDIEDVRSIKVSALKNVTEKNKKIQEPIRCTESNITLSNRRRLNQKIPTYLQCCQTPIASCDKKTIKIKQCNNISTSDNIPYETEDFTVNTVIKPSDKKNVLSKNNDISLSPKICDQESLVVENVSSINKDNWDMPNKQYNCLSEQNSVNNDCPDITSPQNNNNKSMSLTENDNFIPDENLKSADIVCTDANETRISSASRIRNEKETVSDDYNEKQLINFNEKNEIEVDEANSRLQSSCLASPDKITPISIMENKIATIANFRKLQCLRCRRKFTSINNLRRHIAMHIGWNRYRCKLCNFKSFVKHDCIAHCNKVHNIRSIDTDITEVVLKIPEDEYTSNIITKTTSSKIKSDNSNITNITTVTLPCQSEIHADSNNFSDNTHIISQNEVTSKATNKQVAKSHKSTKRLSIDAVNSDKTTRMQNLLESMMSGRKLDNPELKNLVMEVIIGSTDTNAIKQTDDKSILEISDNTCGHTDANDNINPVSIDESKERTCLILDNAKHQRPTRNRIKPLNEDFIYDLKKLTNKKESTFINDSEILHIRKKVKLYNY